MTSCLWGVGSLMVVKELLEDLDPLAKEDFAAFMAKKVLGPLGMNRSTYVAPYPEADLVNTAMGHPWDPRGSFKEYPSQSVAGLWTTAEDLAKGMIVMQKLLAGDPSAPPVLSPDLAKEMFTPQETGTDPCVDKIPHFHAKQGLGYLLEGGNCGVERFWHWGQVILVLVMTFTGFRLYGIHEWIPYSQAVTVHTYAALLLMLLWIFAIFWHFTTGTWKHYVPTSDGFERPHKKTH